MFDQLLPVIDGSYAFDDLKAAYAHVDTGHKKGNVVVTVEQRSNARMYARKVHQSDELMHV